MRATGSTKMNEMSSRSHAVFIIIVEQVGCCCYSCCHCHCHCRYCCRCLWRCHAAASAVAPASANPVPCRGQSETTYVDESGGELTPEEFHRLVKSSAFGEQGLSKLESNIRQEFKVCAQRAACGVRRAAQRHAVLGSAGWQAELGGLGGLGARAADGCHWAAAGGDQENQPGTASAPVAARATSAHTPRPARSPCRR